jgi:hypothetical protein
MSISIRVHPTIIIIAIWHAVAIIIDAVITDFWCLRIDSGVIVVTIYRKWIAILVLIYTFGVSFVFTVIGAVSIVDTRAKGTRVSVITRRTTRASPFQTGIVDGTGNAIVTGHSGERNILTVVVSVADVFRTRTTIIAISTTTADLATVEDLCEFIRAVFL